MFPLVGVIPCTGNLGIIDFGQMIAVPDELKFRLLEASTHIYHRDYRVRLSSHCTHVCLRATARKEENPNGSETCNLLTCHRYFDVVY